MLPTTWWGCDVHKDDMDGLTRRGFLKASCGASAAAFLTGLNLVTFEDVAAAAVRNPLPAGEQILVLVTLYGGNDGLNTVIPYTNPQYAKLRNELAYGGSEVLQLNAELGLNPGMAGFKSLWDNGKLAIVQGVGYPQSNHSHFTSMDIWQTANPTSPTGTGWVGRWLDHTKSEPLTALNIGTTMPPLLVGKQVSGSTLPISGLRVPQGRLRPQLRKLGNTEPGMESLRESAARAIADWYGTAYTTTDALRADLPEVADPAEEVAGATGTGGEGQLGEQLAVVARLINANVPTRVYSVSLGGFDTHSNEKGTQTALLRQVSSAINNFMRQIGASSRANDVTVFVYSEFGRRVPANLNQGTDHGTAGPAFIIGPRVKGGFYGEQPSLTNLRNDDLEVGIDFRDLYASLLESVLGTEAAPVLGNWAGRLDFAQPPVATPAS